MNKIEDAKLKHILDGVKEGDDSLTDLCTEVGVDVEFFLNPVNIDEDIYIEITDNYKKCSGCGEWLDVCSMITSNLCDSCYDFDEDGENGW